jgi:hypothetical protein
MSDQSEAISDQYVLSRRKAITLFGISAASMGAAIAQSNSSSTHASTGELDDMAASARPQYIFGYGSLVQRGDLPGHLAGVARLQQTRSRLPADKDRAVAVHHARWQPDST